MFLRIRSWMCLMRPSLFPGKRTYVKHTKQFMLCRRSVPVTETSVHLLIRHPQWNKTPVCKCSTVDHSELDDRLQTDEEESAETNEEGKGSDELPRIKAARLELEVMRSSGVLVPDSINDADMEYFSTLNTKKSRKRFAAFLYRKEKMRLKEKEKRRMAREAREAESPKLEVEDNLDGQLKNRLFLQLQQQSILQFDNWHLAVGMKFGPRVVYDFNYDEHMKRPEIISLVKQLTYCIGANKVARDPFHIHWVGLQDDSVTMREMKRMLGEHLNTLMVSITDKQVQDIFPVQDIVYLTADSPNILRSYDPSKVYILGALVDSHKILRGVSFAKAKRLDLNHARLPLDLFLKWSTGGKNLTLDQMIQILIELNTSGDWVKALSHVPTRKHEGLKSEQLIPQHQGQRAFREESRGQETRYSSSRAKHSRSWPMLEEVPFHRPKRINSTPLRQRARQVIDDDEDDPSNETIFSSSGGYEYQKRNTQKSSNDKRWFELED